MFRIGVLSDTHGHFDPDIPRLFKGVDHILHGGDIGLARLILDLESIAPVTAVSGNTDCGLNYRQTEVVSLCDRKFLVHHIVDVRMPSEDVKIRILREQPDVVVFGHTHRRFCERMEGALYLNPGYAGRARLNQTRSVAILRCGKREIIPEFLEF